MKIVHVVNHFRPCMGGVERIAEDMCTKLSERGHEVKVVCLDRCANSDKALFAREWFKSTLVERIPFIDLKYYKPAFSVLKKIRGADVVHVHGIGFFSDFLLLTKWMHKKPVVVSTHGGIFHTKSIGLLKKIYFFGIQKLLLNAADKVIAVSKNDEELFSKVSGRVELLENGVNVKKFRAGKKKKNSFLFLGRFSKNKRVELLLKAFAEVKKAKKKFSLVIAGTDWENLLREYENLALALGIEENTVFLENLSEEETGEIYSQAEYFVSASQYEGFGIAVVEAMASGCIAVVQENEGHSKTIKEGESGFLIDYANSEKAAKKIIEIMEKGSAKISKNALHRAGEFSWEKRIPQLENIYRGAL